MVSGIFIFETIHYQSLIAHLLEKLCAACVVSDEHGYACTSHCNPLASQHAPAHAGRMSTITKTHLLALKAHLQQREQQLLQELANAHSEQVQNAQDNEDLPREPDANQSRDTSDREVRHAEQMRDQQELKDVRAALVRMEDGCYGECMDCGKGIALARLQAFPSAKRCIACQTLHEDKKRRA